MGLFPLPRRLRCYMGPHMTCMVTAETHCMRYSRRTYSSFDLFLQKSIVFSHMRFTLYFTAGILSMSLFLIMMLVFLSSYLLCRLFLRFQFKFTVFLIMLGREHIRFMDINTYLFYYLHVQLMLIGGFGWISLLFIEL